MHFHNSSTHQAIMRLHHASIPRTSITTPNFHHLVPSTFAIPSPPQATPPNPYKTPLQITSIANKSRSKH